MRNQPMRFPPPAVIGWFPTIFYVVGGLLLIGAALFALLYLGLFVWVCYSESHLEEAPDTDVIIVLGAQVRENGPSVVLRYRLDTAADYLRDNPSTICIVSGGQGYNEPVSEAVAMRDYLVARGIDETRIRMESASKNTVENMEFSKVFFDPAADSVGIVTNNSCQVKSSCRGNRP